ncbi:class I SAM-dependent methyltransferase [Solirubrobacter ginsenosidimutans]|uniref:Class I SAM-dependent methyltransferase n=1 Tax=Solirubrobacter ginsenosidimutans TaxID=490573 RepID=A0A9X3N1I0_9ACTN|nr:class I SAM-dependent methyltransferase [Solirubrobacter ginsenosidimutans]MDA0166512.1 class I SAM-dependent methyltransferase [Solirubrobacter ginsenosidimutans]
MHAHPIQSSLAARGGPRPGDVSYAGQKQYTPAFLDHIYDRVVVGFSNRYVWRCRSAHIVGLYNEHVTEAHLDVGPGTGYFLDRCTFEWPTPDITLLDLNPHVLDVAARRLARYAPRTYQADLLEPLELQPGAFGSIAATHVLHCVPGTMGEKAGILERLSALLRPGGVLFGTTVLAGGVPQTLLSRAHIAGLNREGIFSNRADTLDGLRDELDARFDDYELTTRGSLAIFEIRA